MPLSEGSNAEVFINTGLNDKRVNMLKSREKLRSLSEDVEDMFEVMVTGLII